MHIRDFEVTTASMVAELPADRASRARAWVALGNPCASVFVPVLAPSPSMPESSLPDALAHASWARRFAALGRVAETDGASLETVRAVLAPVEAALWDEADSLGTDPHRWRAYAAVAERQVTDALDTLARTGVGLSA
jgi:hypothetical protein